MSLVNQVNDKLATAMKQGAAGDVAVLRLVKASFQNEQIKLGHELTSEEELKVVQREAKQRKDSIAQYEAANRQDLAKIEKQELEIIQTYLPQQMSETELKQLVDTVATELNATGIAQMGAVIGAVMKQAGGKAEGATVSRLVKERLTS
jgi:uncharacterized protein YqeY